MSNRLHDIDPTLPDGIGEIISQIEREENFLVPDGYFNWMEQQITGQVKLEVARNSGVELADDGYFDSLESKIMGRIHLQEMAGSDANEFQVPSNYFEASEKKIIRASAGARIISPGWKAVLYPAMAAAAVVAGIMLFQPVNGIQTDSFAALLEKTELTEADLEYFASEEDYYQLWMDEVDDLLNDTIIEPMPNELQQQDSLATIPNEPALKNIPAEKGNAKKPIDPTTPRPTERQKQEKAISFDDLTEEEIWQYLLEDGGDLFEELK
ncbi:MAG: hypothetical protein SH856_13370 [Flavobacteriales bacterium]|nr:hypothetical protein [Flavobacteriales bacterium]